LAEVKRKKMDSHEFMRQLHNLHYMTAITEQIEVLDTIDKIVDFMGDELPEAQDIIDRIQWRLRNDENF